MSNYQFVKIYLLNLQDYGRDTGHLLIFTSQRLEFLYIHQPSKFCSIQYHHSNYLPIVSSTGQPVTEELVSSLILILSEVPLM